MKHFLLIVLLFASVCSKARSITRCGYPFQLFAMTGAVMAAQTEIGPEEVALWSLTTFTQQGDGSWCFSMPVMNGINPLPKPMPGKIKKLLLNVLAENCSYSSPTAAEAGFQNAMIDVKHCHFVDEDASYSYAEVLYDHNGTGTPTGRFCYKIMGY